MSSWLRERKLQTELSPRSHGTGVTWCVEIKNFLKISIRLCYVYNIFSLLIKSNIKLELFSSVHSPRQLRLHENILINRIKCMIYCIKADLIFFICKFGINNIQWPIHALCMRYLSISDSLWKVFKIFERNFKFRMIIWQKIFSFSYHFVVCLIYS